MRATASLEYAKNGYKNLWQNLIKYLIVPLLLFHFPSRPPVVEFFLLFRLFRVKQFSIHHPPLSLIPFSAYITSEWKIFHKKKQWTIFSHLFFLSFFLSFLDTCWRAEGHEVIYRSQLKKRIFFFYFTQNNGSESFFFSFRFFFLSFLGLKSLSFFPKRWSWWVQDRERKTALKWK